MLEELNTPGLLDSYNQNNIRGMRLIALALLEYSNHSFEVDRIQLFSSNCQANVKCGAINSL